MIPICRNGKEIPWKVSFGSGKFGKSIKLFDGTFNAGVSYDGKLAVTGSKLCGHECKWTGFGLVWERKFRNASLSRDS